MRKVLAALLLFSVFAFAFEASSGSYTANYHIGTSGLQQTSGSYEVQYVITSPPVGSFSSGSYAAEVGPCYGGICPAATTVPSGWNCTGVSGPDTVTVNVPVALTAQCTNNGSPSSCPTGVMTISWSANATGVSFNPNNANPTQFTGTSVGSKAIYANFSNPAFNCPFKPIEVVSLPTCSISINPSSGAIPPSPETTDVTVTFSQGPVTNFQGYCDTGNRQSFTQNGLVFTRTCSYTTVGTKLIRANGTVGGNLITCTPNPTQFVISQGGSFCDGNDATDFGEECGERGLTCSEGFACQACQCVPTGGGGEGNILRIEGGKVVSGTGIPDFEEKAVITILLNDPETGLAVVSDPGIALSVFDADSGDQVVTLPIEFVKPGVFQAKIDLAEGEVFDRKNLRAEAWVVFGGTKYEDAENPALILVTERKALPETDLIAVLALVLMSLLFMRVRGRGRS